MLDKQQSGDFSQGFMQCDPWRVAPGTLAEPRLSTCVILYYCLEGSGSLVAPLGPVDFSTDDLLLLAPGQSHRLRAAPGFALTCLSLDLVEYDFPANLFGDHDVRLLIEGLKGRACEGRHRLSITAATRTAARKHFLRLGEQSARSFRGRNAVLKAEAFALFAALLLDPDLQGGLAAEMPTAASLGRMHHVLSHIQEHFCERITVKAMSTCAGLSRSHFHAAFRKATGCSLIEYVNHYRVMRAKKEVMRTDRPLADIAHDYGFASPSRFSIVYRQIWGITPSQARADYRKTHRDDSLRAYAGTE